MYCKYCGANIPDDAKFCTSCGKELASVPTADKKIEADGAQGSTVYPETVDITRPIEEINKQKEYEAKRSSLANKILESSIIGLATAYVIPLVGSIIGIIFALISRKKINQYTEAYGEPTGKAKIGKFLSLGALLLSILNIVSTITAIISFWITLIGIIDKGLSIIEFFMNMY